MATAEANMNTSERKYLKIEDLETTESGAVWVSNNTDRGGQEPGKLIMSIPKVHGQGVDLVRIPKTFIPVNLALQVPKRQLLESAEFRKTVMAGHVKIWNPKWAAIVLAQDESKEEARRIDNEMRATKAAIDSAMVADDEDETFDPSDTSAGKTAAASKMAKVVETKEVEKAKAKASVKVQQLALDATNANAPQSRIIAQMKNVSKMNEVDIKYLARQFKEMPKVRAYLKDRLAQLAK